MTPTELLSLSLFKDFKKCQVKCLCPCTQLHLFTSCLDGEGCMIVSFTSTLHLLTGTVVQGSLSLLNLIYWLGCLRGITFTLSLPLLHFIISLGWLWGSLSLFHWSVTFISTFHPSNVMVVGDHFHFCT